MIRLVTPLGTTEMVVGVGVRRDVVTRARAVAPRARRVGYVVDERVDGLWPTPTWPDDLEPVVVRLPAGEAAKQREVLAGVQDALLDLRRDEPVIVRGGGAALDVGGLAAATVRRGLPWIAVPTTVVAMADAALGGKTAVNHPRGKNLLGVFHPPAHVLADVDHLATLPEREIRAGLAEVYKCARLGAPGLHRLLAGGVPRDAKSWVAVLEASARLKADVVAQDERDHGVRRRLNYGHTVGHALERVLGPERMRHGEAVAMGMVVAAALAVRRGLLPAGDAVRQREDLERLGLPVRLSTSVAAADVLAAIAEDKKRTDDARHTFVLPIAPDDVRIVDDVTDDEITTALAAIAP
ncbi:MAG: 3-dehydroquinate synthase family protein [Planctomycetota bacterium]